MGAREWFEGVRVRVLEVADLERRIEEYELGIGPKGQKLGAIGHASGPADDTARVLAAVEDMLALIRKRSQLEPYLDIGTEILYGAGGVSKLKSEADANCICGYYLMGLSWRQVAEEIARPDSRDARHWCMMRARRAFEWMDRNLKMS